mmetsp:Transcript_13984/g.35710  ORF Transcript_13984/g.35710 Transcript_13984/m.35710 type:complete len:160 (-) Transcript_13984:354-833(-)|eukprot:CAMPEP_0174926454 /NCGR_PEP_ID=MMETSP1355-20121228/11250_1 /TAXON_ID=464990 /ORGANISM="Hemiselmis tepida, Strain CCMP443" /LENGTH=159 /DNA_ID=CAMNT_0016172487 /DNA_START=221 /DNA_END=700 /DNA_ORIENTATION=-
MTSTCTGYSLRILLLVVAAASCAAEGMSQHHASAGSLRGDSASSSGDLAGSRVAADGDRDTRLSLSPSSPLRSTSPLEEGARLSLAHDEAIYPPPSARGQSWRFDLTHSVASPTPARGRGSSPRTRSCARCNSVEGMDASPDEGLEKVNLRMDFAHISV